MPPSDLATAVGEMLALLQRDRDRIVAARVITDIIVDGSFYAGTVELRPVGNWGLIDAYRDIDQFIAGGGRLLDEDIAHRGSGSFTHATLRTDADVARSHRVNEGYELASRVAIAKLETLTSALRLAMAATTQAVVASSVLILTVDVLITRFLMVVLGKAA